MARKTALFWLILIIAATVAGAVALAESNETLWLAPLLAVAWVVTAVGLWIKPLQPALAAPLRTVRRFPSLFWFVILAYLTVTVSLWLVNFQPTNGRGITAAEYAVLLLIAWGFTLLVAYDMHPDTLRAMGGKLSKSPLSGVMVTLTTILLIFFAGEAYLRIFYITTDSYGFTAMNFHWYNNFYWGQGNSLGYRDHEPRPGDDLTRVAVVGDSFAMGHGINDLDRSFPQLLEQSLGADYDVNLIAQSGWDTNIELYQLEQYPYEPDVLVLSYYLNDIDYLLQDNPALNPDSNFDFPENPTLHWFILNYFVPNYIYYNLMQFTSPVRTSNHLQDLVDAHTDPDIWAQQAQLLGEIVTWADRNDVQLILLLWPHITAIDESRPATEQVRGFFSARGAAVVDMGDALAGRSPAQLIVNRFDAHPGIEAQQIAADRLHEAIVGQP